MSFLWIKWCHGNNNPWSMAKAMMTLTEPISPPSSPASQTYNLHPRHEHSLPSVKTSNFVNSMRLDVSLICGQGCDGVSSTSGRFNGEQAEIKKSSPATSYVHCASHVLNLVTQKAFNVSPQSTTHSVKWQRLQTSSTTPLNMFQPCHQSGQLDY